ncbi:MAG: hypothetical protein NTX39_12395 [Opitutae bacterium]|nr:hypothetical protein [Opitutae bacterium]
MLACTSIVVLISKQMHRGVYIVILLLVRISIQAADQLTPLSTVAGLAHGAQAPQNSTVSALAVADYAPGHYTGPLTPSPPHADRNPRQAVIIAWPGLPARFIFSHEASYCPMFEFPSGAAMCNQFFEGNLGEAELMNNLGRKEKNSSVEIMEAGPARAAHGDFLVHTALDLYSDKCYNIYWDEKGKVRRQGDDATLQAISHSQGFALVQPFREGLMFAIMGVASGFPAENSQLIDHCTPGAEGGSGWGTGLWDHWPIGWLNSQTSYWKPGSPYPFSFGSIGHFLVPPGKRIRKFWQDYSAYCADMNFNRWTERRNYYVLLGTARDLNEVRQLGRQWLNQGPDCARPESIAKLR